MRLPIGTEAPRGPLDVSAPDPNWWLHDPWGIHGVTHVARVLVWAEVAAQTLLVQGAAVDLAVVRWSAILHDCRRHDDGTDTAHGARAASWIADRRQELLPGLRDEQIEAIQHCVFWHVPHDWHCPRMTDELRCLKDADGLDRVRLGDFEPNFL